MDLLGISTTATAIKDVLGMFFPDKTEKEKMEMAQTFALIQGQLDANKVEASNVSLFTSGWRPSVGWTCSLAFAVQFVVGPLAQWGSTLAGHPVVFPTLDLGTMMPILVGMLGLGYYRTQEKIAGVSK
jgi:hypothetical protein